MISYLQKTAFFLSISFIGIGSVMGQTAGPENVIVGDNPIVYGKKNNSNGGNSGAIGYGNTLGPSSFEAFAFGSRNQVSADGIAIGRKNSALIFQSFAAGFGNVAGNKSAAIGENNSATGYMSSAFGYGCVASGTTANAFGKGNVSSGYLASSFGFTNSASATNALAFGKNNWASGEMSSAFGYANRASGKSSSAFGKDNLAQGNMSSVFGKESSVTAEGAVALGYKATSSANYAAAIGFNITNNIANSIKIGTSNSSYVLINNSGNMGIGTSSPVAKLHVNSNTGMTIDGGNAYQYSGDLVVQSNTGGRNSTKGAALEFVIPANSDGSNPWGQARIVTVAGNGDSGNATGKMILGTRRMFDKLGTGQQWFYGNDIVIDHVGNVGIGTLNPQELLSVKGKVRAQEVKVEAVNWPDYVFTKEHRLPSLTEVEAYIKSNSHLPEIPSAKEVKENGVSLGEMNTMLVKKVEELTLYLIEQSKVIQQQNQVINEIKSDYQKVKQRLEKIDTKE